MLRVTMVFAFAALVLGTVVSAQDAAATKDAPAINVSDWVMNAPEEFDGTNLKGQVVLVDLWGVNCGPCIALIPHLNHLQAKYGGKGLTIVAAERQNATPEAIRKGFPQITYPVIAGGPAGYDGVGSIPYAYLVGVDGKIIFKGNPHSMGNLLEEEVAKIKFPGLGKLEVQAKAATAAKLFSDKNYGKSRDAAQKIVDSIAKGFEGGTIDADKLKDDDKALLADAQYILERITTTSTALKAKAEAQESSKLYLHAQRSYSFLQTAFGKKSEEGEAAAEKLKVFSKDKDIRREILAYTELEKVQANWKGKSVRADKFNADMERIVKSYAGTKAAEDAQAAKVVE